MRVVAGVLRSRTLRAPRGDATRPTTDRVRESLFAVLGDVHGAVVLDLYAGSGALAIEALSRGAATAVCVESARAAVQTIRDNARDLGLQQRLHVVARRVAECGPALGAHAPFTLVFADPPWAMVPDGIAPREVATLLAAPGRLAEGATIVLEHAARDASPALAGLVEIDARRWGDTAVTIYQRAPRLPDADAPP